MLLQINSYLVPKEKRTEHARLIRRFRHVLARLGLSSFECFEQTGPDWSGEVAGRFVQMLRFRDRAHYREVRAVEETDPAAQTLVRAFCELINYSYQQQQGLATTVYFRDGPSAHEPARTVDPEPSPENARSN